MIRTYREKIRAMLSPKHKDRSGRLALTRIADGACGTF
jgi:hypothetical protein